MKKVNVRKMATLSLMIALIVVLQLLGYVLPRVGPFGLSFVLVPIIIGAAFFGPKEGAILGSAFGVIVCICCYNGLDAGGFMVWQASPLLCVLVVVAKGVLAGFGSGLIYKCFKHKNEHLGITLSAIICPVLNTGIFLLGMKLFFFDVLSAWAGGSNVAGYVLTGIVLANFVPELLINVILSPACHRILKNIK